MAMIVQQVALQRGGLKVSPLGLGEVSMVYSNFMLLMSYR